MDGQEISSRSAVARFADAVGLATLIPEPAALQRGVVELEAAVARVALDAHLATTRGCDLAKAVRDTSYPFLRQIHLAITDILTMSLEPKLVEWMRKVLAGPTPGIVDEVRFAVARAAADAAATPQSRALAKFLLFEAVRLNLIVATWRTGGLFEAVGGKADELDLIAEKEVNWLLANASTLASDVRPLNVMVAAAMVELTAHVESLRALLVQVSDDVKESQQLQATVEVRLRRIDCADALLIRNETEMAQLLDEQHVPLQRLQNDHPLALGALSRGAMDQRVSRLRRKLLGTDASLGSPRRQPSLWDLVNEVSAKRA